MSFAGDVKKELCGLIPEKECCRGAEYSGMLLFANSFSPTSVKLLTESFETAKKLATYCYEISGMDASIQARQSEMYILTVEREEDCAAIFSHINGEMGPFLRINQKNLKESCCVQAFLRGAFLSCGSVTDPKKEYHLEFVTPYFRLAADLMDLLSFAGFSPKSVIRKSNQIVYFKESEAIEDLLTYIGAQNAVFEIMNVKIYKDIRNNTNRVNNCETANLGKTVSAAARQVEAIQKLSRMGAFNLLPEELQETARLRLKNPYLSLAELGKKSPEKLTRSGLNHRLRRIVAFAEEIAHTEKE